MASSRWPTEKRKNLDGIVGGFFYLFVCLILSHEPCAFFFNLTGLLLVYYGFRFCGFFFFFFYELSVYACFSVCVYVLLVLFAFFFFSVLFRFCLFYKKNTGVG